MRICKHGAREVAHPSQTVHMLNCKNTKIKLTVWTSPVTQGFSLRFTSDFSLVFRFTSYGSEMRNETLSVFSNNLLHLFFHLWALWLVKRRENWLTWWRERRWLYCVSRRPRGKARSAGGGFKMFYCGVHSAVDAQRGGFHCYLCVCPTGWMSFRKERGVLEQVGSSGRECPVGGKE